MKTYAATCFCLVMAVMALWLAQGWAESEGRSCINLLAPCLRYLNGTREPPDICCDPLKSVIESNPRCLCSLISNRGADEAQEAGININQAQQLPGRCGQHVNPIACLTNSRESSDSNQKFLRDTVMMVAVLALAVQILGASS